MAITQENRPIAITTPLGDDQLLLERFTGREAVSRPFTYEAVVLAQPDFVVAYDQLLGQKVSIRLNNSDGDPRYFAGIVNRISQGMQVRSADTGDVFLRYYLQIVPEFLLLNNIAQSRIFQNKTVKEILTTVLTGIDSNMTFAKDFDARNYCVQYRETDYQFACRLMEEEGIRYYFEHTSSGHKLQITDKTTTFSDLPGGASISFNDFTGLRDQRTHEDRIYGWQKTQEMRSGKFTLRDHYFQDPDKTLEASATVLSSVAVGTITHKLAAGGNDKHEIYDFPGGYVRRYDGIDRGGATQTAAVETDSERTVKVRMEQETASALSISAESNVRRMAPGFKFSLINHFDANGSYQVTEVDFGASIEGSYTTTETVPLKYQNRFGCVPAALPYRPSRVTRRPTVAGAQTAVVVGDTSTSEIFSDKFGRVKVQFFWDRDGKKDLDSSCWLRVAQPWAGKGWGAIFLPRVGHEVLVDFLEGDPDQPIIVGSVYNADQTVPYELPANQTRSTIKTRSSEKGTAENFNEIRFEDLKDKEEIYFHAERDFNRVVENNDTLKVGFDKKDKGDQTIEIYNDRTERVQEGNEKVTIEKGNRTVTVSKGNDLHEVSTGDRTVKVVKGNDLVEVSTGNRTLTVSTGNRTVTVSKGNDSHEVSAGSLAVKVTAGDAKHDITAGTFSVEAGTAIELKVGANSIKIEQSGITINATQITLQGKIIGVTADAKLDLAGKMTSVNGDGMLILKGGLVKIN